MPPLATVGSFSEFFLDGMMDDDDDDARFCLNRSSDDDGRRACPSVSAMAASVGSTSAQRVRSRALHVRWIRTQHASDEVGTVVNAQR
jgi:hypothetical protein